MSLTRKNIGRQVSPVATTMLCELGMYGLLIDVWADRILVRWADGRVREHSASDVTLVPRWTPVR